MRKITVLQEAELLCGFGIWSRHVAETGQSQQWQRIQYANKSHIYYKMSPPFRKLDNKQGGPHLAQKSQNYIHSRKTVAINHLGKIWVNNRESQEATVRTGCRTTDWFQIGKGIYQGCVLSPCLFNIYADTSDKMPGWMKHKLESRLPGEISITSDRQMTPPLWQKVKN